MIPHRIALENFLTFAGPVEFDFTGDEPVWVIGGPNGVGKSAVFDAVTFALFGVHRGGKQRFDELVRHGADSFRVVLEFGFDGTDYRITRAFSGNKQVVPKLESRRASGFWVADKRVNKVADLTPLVEELLGLNYDTFTQSVLLKQGEADKLFSASREERAALLKKIIGFKQYEELSTRVHNASTQARGGLEILQRQFAETRAVSVEELADAERASVEAEAALTAARAANDEAVVRVERAKRWVELESHVRDLNRRLADADEREHQRESIRDQKQRLDALTFVVPLLTSLANVRADLATHAANQERLIGERTHAVNRQREWLAEAESRRTRSTEAKQRADGAEGRQKEIAPLLAQNGKWLTAANELVKLASELSRFPEHLQEAYAKAKEVEAVTQRELEDAAQKFTEADTLWNAARNDASDFSEVQVGVTCPHCRQPVSAEHAADVRRRLQDRLCALQMKRAECDVRKREAIGQYEAALGTREGLGQQVAARDRAEIKFNTKREALEQDGGTTDASQLAKLIAALEAECLSLAGTAREQRELQRADEAEAQRLTGETEQAQQAIGRCDRELGKVATQIAALTGRQAEVVERVPGAWATVAADVSAESLRPLATELTALQRSNVAALAEQLEEDTRQRNGWVRLRAEALDAIEAVPEADRVSESEAVAARDRAASAARSADASHATAATTLRDLHARAEHYASTARALKATERRAELHKRLDDLLGESGLHRDLIRAAEHEVVSLADDTLRSLSNQELSIEPDPDVTGRADKAFALRVRKAGDPKPIGVDFISGSQKFRVAVALALAVGRFAAGKQRPIEAVIIDEGFGSLDEDGLRAMAENLHELRRTQALKRILLVSHQKNFTDQFSSGYRLTPSETGTVAERLS